MHSRAYPYGITRCSAWGRIFDGAIGGLSKPQRTELFRVMDSNFGEFTFHALR
jgi:hypothetical protein